MSRVAVLCIVGLVITLLTNHIVLASCAPSLQNNIYQWQEEEFACNVTTNLSVTYYDGGLSLRLSGTTFNSTLELEEGYTEWNTTGIAATGNGSIEISAGWQYPDVAAGLSSMSFDQESGLLFVATYEGIF